MQLAKEFLSFKKHQVALCTNAFRPPQKHNGKAISRTLNLLTWFDWLYSRLKNPLYIFKYKISRWKGVFTLTKVLSTVQRSGWETHCWGGAKKEYGWEEARGIVLGFLSQPYMLFKIPFTAIRQPM